MFKFKIKEKVFILAEYAACTHIVTERILEKTIDKNNKKYHSVYKLSDEGDCLFMEYELIKLQPSKITIPKNNRRKN